VLVARGLVLQGVRAFGDGHVGQRAQRQRVRRRVAGALQRLFARQRAFGRLASAQESAGAALELNSQAEDMKELVAGFILTGSRMIGTTKPAGLIPLETEPAEVEL